MNSKTEILRNKTIEIAKYLESIQPYLINTLRFKIYDADYDMELVIYTNKGYEPIVSVGYNCYELSSTDTSKKEKLFINAIDRHMYALIRNWTDNIKPKILSELEEIENLNNVII